MPESVALSDLSATLCGARGHSASPTLRSTVPHRRRGPCSSVVGERGLPVRTPAVLWVTTYRVKTERGPGSETGFAVSGPDAMGATVGCTPRIGRPEYRAGTRPGTLLDLWSYSRTSPPPSGGATCVANRFPSSVGAGLRSLLLLTKPDSEVGAASHGKPCPGVYGATAGSRRSKPPTRLGRCIAAAFQVIWSPLVVAVSTPRRWHGNDPAARGSGGRVRENGLHPVNDPEREHSANWRSKPHQMNPSGNIPDPGTTCPQYPRTRPAIA